MSIQLCDCYIIHHVTIPFSSIHRLSAQLSSEDYSVLTSTLSPLVQNSDTEQVTNSGAKRAYSISLYCCSCHCRAGRRWWTLQSLTYSGQHLPKQTRINLVWLYCLLLGTMYVDWPLLFYLSSYSEHTGCSVGQPEIEETHCPVLWAHHEG